MQIARIMQIMQIVQIMQIARIIQLCKLCKLLFVFNSPEASGAVDALCDSKCQTSGGLAG